jgi:hypothetical protein
MAAEAETARWATQAEEAFREARGRWQQSSTNVEAAWRLGRAAYDWAEYAQDNAQRERVAQEGIAACRQAIAQQPRAVAPHYYLGLNLGQLAQARKLSALRIVDEMEREFKVAREIDPQFDFAGPDRHLGVLYFRAPGWPTSVGSKRKAQWHLEQAVKLGPDYPGNRLNLMEAWLKWGQRVELTREMARFTELVPRARQQLAGAAWEPSWHEWHQRWERMQKQAGTDGE